MAHTVPIQATTHAQAAKTSRPYIPTAHAALLNNLDALLETARPRLVRLAHLHGVAPNAADDIAQETLLAAWRSLHHLRAPERFDAWLDGICRNLCCHWANAQRATSEQTRPLALSWHDDESSSETAPLDLPDPQALDPAEELGRQDLEVLLDRALGHLPASAREALELCYLAELPQREAALRLGLTIGALELRLHRARKQLRELLSGAFRADAEAFGLLPDDEPSSGWRESREWCNHCGRQRLRGVFEPMPDGRINFRMRCPACSLNQDLDMTESGGLIALHGLRTFRPARKQVNKVLYLYQHQALTDKGQRCMTCQQPLQAGLFSASELRLRASPGRIYAVLQCPNGHHNISWSGGIVGWGQREVEAFQASHPRWVSEPDAFTEYAGQPALRFRLVDIASASRLTIFAHHPSLCVLALFQE